MYQKKSITLYNNKIQSFFFTYYFEYIINHLLKYHTTFSSNININKRPSPLKIDLNDDNIILYFKSFYYILSDIINFNEGLNIEIIKTIIYKDKISINEEILDKQKLIKNFNQEISNLKNDNNIKERIK